MTSPETGERGVRGSIDVVASGIEFKPEANTIMIDPNVDLETVGRLLALVAHDLRNPLSAIHSNLGFLNSALLDDSETANGFGDNRGDEVRDALSDGLISCEGLTHMIDNIETLGQVLRGAPLPSKSPVSVAELVQDTVTRCIPVADSYGIKLEHGRCPPDLADTASHAAREHMAKALGNLIRNSIQHSSPGQTVRISARWPEGDKRERVHIVVEDQGTPITAGSGPGLFTADGQVRAKASSEGRYSRALGLYVARLGAELAGGDVRAETVPDTPFNRLILDFPVAR